MGLTERLARGCAARPRLTLALWGAAVLVALALVATALHGLSSQGNVEGNPESTKAKDTIAQVFPGEVASEQQDVIVVTSSRYKVGSPQFRAFGKQLATALRATGEVRGARSVAVSPDRHSALVSVHIGSDSGAGPVEKIVEKANGGAFEVGITGYHSTGYDFGKQSQTDLEKGELAFGLPAALIVLVLVFAAVVAGLVPVLMAILSIIVALGLVAVISLEFSLSVFIVNMLTGMGLALGIDYSLFVVSRYREERNLGFAKDEAIALSGARRNGEVRAAATSGSISSRPAP
jgi:RND superfamily putative drug exporter